MPQKKETGIQSIQRAFAILEKLYEAGQPLSAIEISEAAGINRTTAYGIINTLLDTHYIEKDLVTGKYRPSIKMHAMSCNYAENLPLIQLCGTPLRDLAERFEAILHFSLLTVENKLFLLRKYIPVAPEYRAKRLEAGYGIPIHATGGGKIHLAFLPEEKRQVLIEKLTFKPYTRNTIRDMDALMKEVELIRERGFATDENEFLYNSCCIGFPIFGAGNTLVGAFSLSLTNEKFMQKYKSIIPEGLDAANTCSFLMGSTTPPRFYSMNEYTPKQSFMHD